MTIEYHEPPSELSQRTRILHRAFATLVEEIEAIDWYLERIDVTEDESLVALLRHNRLEEMEHAAMTLEWLRRNEPELDKRLRTYLFSDSPLTEIEHREEGACAGDEPVDDRSLGLGKFSRAR